MAGFLLPDHMDESLEVFATDGRPLGELLHDSFSDAVTWEIAPGRTDVAPAAGPTDDPDVTHHRVGWIAAGLVAADAAARNGTPNRPETESALSAMLRAIDTTLWTVDPFGSLGSEHIAGLVGRPIAVVAARLALDVYSDVAERAYSDEALRTGRTAKYDALAALRFEVRLGEITRADDGLLGYFVDDDYAHFHLVDKVIAAEALPSGRGQGVLDPDNPTPTAPVAIDHPYVDASGVLRIHPGQTVRLTLLMHPGGKVHLTSGILPRTDRALARDWVQPGLAVLAPSLRCGPLLIDADKVRLPKVASFPAEQLFTRRDTRPRGRTTRSWPRPSRQCCPTPRLRCRRAGSGSRRTRRPLKAQLPEHLRRRADGTLRLASAAARRGRPGGSDPVSHPAPAHRRSDDDHAVDAEEAPGGGPEPCRTTLRWASTTCGSRSGRR